MTESIFDPTGPETEHSGTRNLGPDAANVSHMPPEVIGAEGEVDAQAAPDKDAQTEQIARAEAESRDRKDRLNPDR